MAAHLKIFKFWQKEINILMAIGFLTLSTGGCKKSSTPTGPSSLQSPLDTTSAVFGGGPLYSGGLSVMNTLRSSGFNTVLIWSIHVYLNGDLYLNDDQVVSNGIYVGSSEWPGEILTLKKSPTSINRVEVSVGSAGVSDFADIQNIIARYGADSNSILYKNFLTLKRITGADCVDLDIEDTYDVGSAVAFSVMCGRLGMHVSFCPYTNVAFWASVRSQTNSQIPGTADRVYLQCYAGGEGNDPATWDNALGGIKVYPGLWGSHGTDCSEGDDPNSVHIKMVNWKSASAGGFMWPLDDMLACPDHGTPAQYAQAINSAFVAGPSEMAGAIAATKFY